MSIDFLLKEDGDKLLKEDSFRESAQRFSQKYRGTDVTNLTDIVLKKINSLLSNSDSENEEVIEHDAVTEIG